MSPLQVIDRQEVVIYRHASAYISHPALAKLRNGDYLVAYLESLLREPYMHPMHDPRFMHLVSRSRDGGQTWEMPRVAPGYEWTGVECPSIVQISSGEVLLIQWQFKWYPLEMARKLVAQGAAPGEIWVLDAETDEWRAPQSEADWDRSPLPWARGDAGCFVHLSTDDGATWEHTAQVDTTPHVRGYSPRPPIELADGTLLLALGSHEYRRRVSYVVRSTDRGRSWGGAVTATPPHPERVPDEPTLLALPSGKVIMMCRENHTSHLHQCDSLDGGRTWTLPQQTPIWGYPAHLVLLSDGRVFCVYGHRRPPYGIRACLSEDDGQTWDYDHELIIRDDMRNANLGYPTAIEEDDGRIFVAYYGEDEEGVTYVLGSHFSLP